MPTLSSWIKVAQQVQSQKLNPKSRVQFFTLTSHGLASLPVVCLEGKHCKQWHWLGAQYRGIFNSSDIWHQLLILMEFAPLGKLLQLLAKCSARQSLDTHPAMVVFIKNPQTFDKISVKSRHFRSQLCSKAVTALHMDSFFLSMKILKACRDQWIKGFQNSELCRLRTP